ncbi:MAG: methylated-DNA--[protein]-cysteine S-methyltransferase [Actinomycetota bacterium]|nr:methylated-DNA--[protein]-cysteine S-methyltransferase [Actinomycetota bacterium]
MMRSWTTDTPAGPFSVLAEDDTVYASGWTADLDSMVAVIAPQLRPAAIEAADDLGEISRAVRSYVDGDVYAINDIPVRQSSGPFIIHAWDVLRDIPAGTTLTYGAFAAKCGRPNAVRAAASACSRNAAALFIPCHRVISASGSLHHFRYGLEPKGWLLRHEAEAATA